MQELILPPWPVVEAEDAEASSMLATAQSTAIVDTATLQVAADLLKSVSFLRKKIEAHYEPVTQATFKAHRAAVAARDEHTKPLAEVERILKFKVGEYQLAERKRVEAAQRAEEQRQAEERARLATEEAALRRKLEDQRIAAAEELHRTGDEAGANKLLDARVEVPAWLKPQPIATPPIVEAPKIAGLGFGEKWRAEVHDKLALVRFVAASPSWLHLLDVNQTQLNGLARAQKAAFAIDGVRAVSEASTTVRG